MSLLVTGASGLIGGAVMRALALAGIGDVLTAGRRDANLALDLAAPPFALPAGITTVLHLAGEKHDPARMAAVNAAGAVALVDAAARAGARHFVHLGSVGVYGAPAHAGVVTEAHPHTPRGPYETSKDAGERGVRARCAALGLRCSVLQPANVIAPERQPLLGLMRAVATGRWRWFGNGDAWVNYVAVDDVAAAVVAACGHATAHGTWIVNTPAPLRMLVGWVAQTLAVPPPTATLPLWLGTLAARACAAGQALTGRALPLSPERLLEMTNTTRYDGSAIARALGFDYPAGIEHTVRALAAAYHRDGLL